MFNAGLYKKLSYDPLKDLVPVALVFNISYTLVGAQGPAVQPREGDRRLRAKKNPNGLKLANAGIGTGQHVVGAAFMKATGTKFLEVPYRARRRRSRRPGGPRRSVLRFHARRACPTSSRARPRASRILTKQRNPQMPDVPTMTESGIPGFEIDSWIGLFAPAKTPPAAIARLQQEIAQVLRRAEAALRGQRRRTDGQSRRTSSTAFIKAEYDKWIKIIQEAGIRLD